MMDTRQIKVEFGQKVCLQRSNDSLGVTQQRTQKWDGNIKIIQRKQNEFSGVRKVNYADEKIKEVYRKINQMLGGN